MKNNINNYYIGKLNFLSNPDEIDTYKALTPAYLRRIFIRKTTLENGAIDYRKYITNPNYKDLNEAYLCSSVITIFSKEKDIYICLHNGNMYQDTKELNDFCENLIPLTTLLPTIDYTYKARISDVEALKLFNIIFKNKGKLKYNNSNIPKFSLFKGNIEVLNGYFVKNEYSDVIEKYTFNNLIQKLIIMSHNTVTSEYIKNEELPNGKIKEYDYEIYDDILLKLDATNFYSINNYQTYNINDKKLEITKSLDEYLNDNNIIYQKNDITIPKVLKLQKQITRKLHK